MAAILFASGTSGRPKGVLAEFMKLTKIPIIVFYGDNIPEKPIANPGQDSWRVSRWRGCGEMR